MRVQGESHWCLMELAACPVKRGYLQDPALRPYELTLDVICKTCGVYD